MENALEVLEATHRLNVCHQLRAFCFSFCEKVMPLLIEREGFLDISEETLIHILESGILFSLLSSFIHPFQMILMLMRWYCLER